jgi:hypothetical protein
MPLKDCLQQVPDPRRAEGRRYELTPMLIGTILAIACGATSYRKVQRFLAAHWRRLIEVFGGTWKRAPAHTTVRNILRQLDPDALEAAFRAPFDTSGQALLERCDTGAGVRIAIDGKVLRGSFDHFADQKAAQILGALTQEEPRILAHVAIDAKSNEIPAAQQLSSPS